MNRPMGSSPAPDPPLAAARTVGDFADRRAGSAPGQAAGGGAGRGTSGAYDPLPPGRTRSALVRTRKYRVRRSLLGDVFFPHYSAQPLPTAPRPGRRPDGSTGGVAPSAVVTGSNEPTGTAASSTHPGGRPEGRTLSGRKTGAVKRKGSGSGAAPTDSGSGSDEDDRELGCRERVAAFMQGRRVQVVLLCLLALDVALVIAEIVILNYKHCDIRLATDDFHGWSSAGAAGGGGGGGHRRAGATPLEKCVAGATVTEIGHAAGYGLLAGAEPCAVRGVPTLRHSLHAAELGLKWASRSILFVFAVELIVLLAALGLRFFTHVMYIIDAVVVFGSIVIEFTIHTGDDGAPPLLVIFARCWRFCRIIHGVGLGVHEVDELELELHGGHGGHGGGGAEGGGAGDSGAEGRDQGAAGSDQGGGGEEAAASVGADVSAGASGGESSASAAAGGRQPARPAGASPTGGPGRPAAGGQRVRMIATRGTRQGSDGQDKVVYRVIHRQ